MKLIIEIPSIAIIAYAREADYDAGVATGIVAEVQIVRLRKELADLDVERNMLSYELRGELGLRARCKALTAENDALIKKCEGQERVIKEYEKCNDEFAQKIVELREARRKKEEK